MKDSEQIVSGVKEAAGNGRSWSLILYPSLADGLSETEERFVTAVFADVDRVEGNEVIQKELPGRLSKREMEAFASRVPSYQRSNFYFLAKRIASAGGLSDSERAALEELRSALRVETEVDDFEFPDRELEPEQDEETFEEIARKYAKIAGVVTFLPIPIVSDSFVLIPLQIRMVKRISDNFGYSLDAKHFVKTIINKAGSEYALSIAGRGLVGFIPLVGWAVAGGISFAVTYATALVAKKYIEQDGALDDESLKETFREAYEEGRREFNALKEEIFKGKDKLVEKIAQFI